MTEEPERLQAAAVRLTGDSVAARQLLSQPLPTFGGKSLLQLAHDGRIDDALAYLESIAQGFVG